MAPATKKATDLTGTLESVRRDLLDLGLRNTLLNYRPLRSKGVDVVGEDPVEVFRVLVTEEKSMTFRAADSSGVFGSDDMAQPDDDRTSAQRHKDKQLQTSYTSAQLQTRLLATYHAARTSMEEQGVNTLYLALGMLSWKDEESSDKFCRAPLILIPAELDRSDARDRFHLKFSGEEFAENVSLAEKLKQSFGIKSYPPLPEPDDLDVADYFRKVARSVAGQRDWRVDTSAIALGFFSFAKFLMYRDLDPTTWPESDTIAKHGLLESLLGNGGFQPSTSQYREDCLLDEQVQNRDVFHVVDADSSQSVAILDCLDGHNMVIQGPPGTGKSQTIVNLIAGAVAQGKRVLFVSEKMAALDVVKRRLDRSRLGAACLELHSNRTNKKTIIEELRRTAFGQRTASPSAKTDLVLLSDARESLNAYCKAVNEPIGASGDNPCNVYGKLLSAEAALNGLELPAMQLEDAETWTAEDAARRSLLVKQLQDRLANCGVPNRHPFWGSRLQVLLPMDRDQVRKSVGSALSTCTAMQQKAGSLAQTLLVAAPNTTREVRMFLETAQHLAGAPALAGVAVTSPLWLSKERLIRQTVVSGKQLHALHGQYDSLLQPQAWGSDVAEVRRIVDDLVRRWWRSFYPRWWRAKKSLASLHKNPSQVDMGSALAVLDGIAEMQRCEKAIKEGDECMASLLGSWKGIGSDWGLVESQADWVIRAQKGIHEGTLAAWCLEPPQIAVERIAVTTGVRALDAALQSHGATVTEWKERLQLDESCLPDGPLSTQSLNLVLQRWEAQAAAIDKLHSLVAFNQISTECRQAQLASVASVAEMWEPASRLLVPLYQRARAGSLLQRAFQERPSLAKFDASRQFGLVDEFRRLDLLNLEYTRLLLAFKHAQSLPSSGGSGEIGILWHEFEKRARFLPIRTLMLKAGHAIQSIKPVFMMSPLSIANYLPPGALTFDLIIFDEASQVRPVDALGAIARGQQVIVVGDSKQLPPTSFFDSLVNSEEPEPDDESTAASDIESVLGLFCSRGAHQRMLQWHYRSRHDSLIAVSNHLFYDDRLVVFPSPERDGKELGLLYRRLENAPYDRGKTRTNPGEAKTVATAVMAHARGQLSLPKAKRDTLGVAAFSMAQMDAILHQLEILRRENPSCEEFFSSTFHEPFFVKNLENVQGDERDVIFISIGYGRTAEGYLATSFGPINRAGGERRLNVLISRARKRCEVFTTLSADDIDTSKTASTGVAALKTFLHFAETGKMDVPARQGRPPDSDFEEQVCRQIEALGYTVHTQVGSAGFFLDLAVVDPVQPGRYLLGIECDGARYHCARSARDRDRLRQAVLEGLGWHIHRIWSTDWFHSPDEALQKVALAIEKAKTATPVTAPTKPVETATVAPAVETPPLPALPAQRSSRTVPYRCADVHAIFGNVEAHLVDRVKLARLLREVVSTESPVHSTEAARRILNSAGIQRLGSRIQQAFQEAVKVGAGAGMFACRGEFLWEPAMKQPLVRDRSDLPAASRKFEFVAPDEIRLAILMVIEDSYGIVPDEVPSAVCRLFGFARSTDDMITAIVPHRDEMLREGILALRGVNLVISGNSKS
jgi:very-short-patch-repair endonuclease/KaiC/GvpD/RAD55 family RecA-like ATPase